MLTTPEVMSFQMIWGKERVRVNYAFLLAISAISFELPRSSSSKLQNIIKSNEYVKISANSLQLWRRGHLTYLGTHQL